MRSFDVLRKLVSATLESVSTASINRYYGLLRPGRRCIQQKVQVRNLRYTDNFPGILLAATPVPLNEIGFTVELRVKDN